MVLIKGVDSCNCVAFVLCLICFMSNLSKNGYDLLINYVETLKHRYYPFINYVNHVKLFNIFTTKKK